MMGRWSFLAVAWLAVLLVAGPPASGEDLSLEDVIGLLEIGVPEEEVLAKVKETGARFELAPADLERLRAAGASEAFVAAVRKEKPVPRTVTIEDVRKSVREGEDPVSIVRRIEETDSKFELTLDDLLRLRREGLPPEVLRAIAARRRDPQAGPPDPGPEPDAGLVPLSDEKTFRVRHPGAWHVLHLTEGGESFQVGPDPMKAGDEPEVSFYIRVLELKDASATEDRLPETAARILGAVKKSEEEQGSKVEVLVEGERRIGGLPAVRWRYRSTEKDGKREIGEIFVAQKGRFLYVMGWGSSEARLGEFEAPLGGVIESFEPIESKLETPAPARPLGRDDVIRLSKEGVAPEEIVRRIRGTDSRFDLSADDALEMRRSGVDVEVIREMRSRPVEWKDWSEAEGLLRYRTPSGWWRQDVQQMIQGCKTGIFLGPGALDDLLADSTGMLLFVFEGEKTPAEIEQLAQQMLENFAKGFRTSGETVEMGKGEAATMGQLSGQRIAYTRKLGARSGQGFLFVGSSGKWLVLVIAQAGVGTAAEGLPALEKVIGTVEVGTGK